MSLTATVILKEVGNQIHVTTDTIHIHVVGLWFFIETQVLELGKAVRVQLVCYYLYCSCMSPYLNKKTSYKILMRVHSTMHLMHPN